jgi:putative endopeptidase
MLKKSILVTAMSFCLAVVSYPQTPSPADAVRQRMKVIVEEQAGKKHPAGSPEQVVADMYASFSDTAKIDSLGLKPMKKDLDRIAAVKTKKEIAELYGQGNFIYNPLFTDIRLDSADPTRFAVGIMQSGLELSKGQYLGTDEKSVQMREKFVEFLTKIVEMTADKDFRARAEKILQFEADIAKVSGLQAKPARWTREELSKNAPGVDWGAYLKSNGLDGYQGTFIIDEPETITGVAKVIETTDLQALKDHLAFSLICTWGWAGVLPQSIYDIQWDFYGKYRQGQAQQPDRWRRAYNFLNRTVPNELGQLYAAKGFTAADKAAVEKELPNVLSAVKTKLGEKAGSIDGVTIEIGFSAKQSNNSKLEIIKDDLYGNAKRAHARNWQREVAQLSAPVDKTAWWVNPYAVAPIYSRGRKVLLIPAGLLQSPVYDPTSKTVNADLLAAAIIKAVPVAEAPRATH